MKNFFKSQYLKSDYNLPEFVKNSPNYHAHFEEEIEIISADGKWGIRFEDKERVTSFDYDTFFEAYYDNREYSRCIWFSDDIAHDIFGNGQKYEDIDEECEVMFDKPHSDDEVSNIANMFFSKKTGRGYYRSFSRRHGDYNIRRLVDDYEEWLVKDKELDINDFNIANITEIYDWLNTNINFWIEKKIGNNYTWITDDAVSSIRAFPIKVDPQSRKALEEYAPDYKTRPYVTEWWIEGGLHVINTEDDERYCVEHYHDFALDDGGDTYDEAFINFARNVWLQSRGLLKEREEKRNIYLERLMKNVEE